MPDNKTEQDRVQECLNMRSQMRHTSLLHTRDNAAKIKEAMNAFIRDGQSSTLRLWADDSHKTRVVISLSNNAHRMSGVCLEK